MNLTMMFFNTTNIQGDALIKARYKAGTQNQIIHEVFRQNPRREMTPFEVNKILGNKYPITSVRRAISTLTKDGELIKTKTRKIGDYGARCYAWRYAYTTPF